MTKLTAVVIAKNEEEMIADCLDSISFCDEVVLIDNGSTDKTAEIAKMMGAKIFVREGIDFAQLRNIGLEKAKGNWVLYIDADERVDKELQEAILDVIGKKKNAFAAYHLQRKNFYLGKHEWPHIEKLERLFQKDSLQEWYGELHESARVTGEIGELSGYILHYTHRDLTTMLAKTISWSETEAQLRLHAGHPPMVWWRFPRVMLSAFIDSYIKQEGWRVGTVGVIESMYQAFSMFITYARLWELQREEYYKMK